MIPFVICLIIFCFKGILQNIENIFVSDLKGQHIVFLNYLKNVWTGNASIFYSFYAGMGSSMISTIIFYCMSPINLLLLLVKDIRYAILFIYIIKVSLSGLTMYILLKNKTDNNNFVTILFSTCYALCSFVINYFFCVFWFDSMYLAPLVTLGIDKMFKHEKINLLYIFSLALAIICNIQMGFGLCVYSLIYYIYSYNINYSIKKDFKKFKQLGIIFAVSSLCAGAISSGALLGFGLDYANIAAAREANVTTSAGVSNIGYILKNIFTVGNLKTEYFSNYEPYIYCGLIVSFFAILYLFNNDIDKKKRLSALGVILVFIVSFCVGFINLFWHLSSPVLLNFRYSAYLSLFLIMLAYECYLTKQKLTKKDIVVLSISLVIGLLMIIGYSNEVYVIWAFAFLVVTFVLILLVKNKSKKFEILLFTSIIAEIFVNGCLSVYTAEQLPFGKYSSYDSLKEVASLNEFEDDYRIMYDYSYTDFMSDTLLLNHNSSLRYFSSVINGNLITFFDRNLTTVGNNNYSVSSYDSPLLISLLGNKYFYLNVELNNSIYNKIDSYEITSYNYVNSMEESKKIYLYENPYALSLGYVIENDATYEDGMDLVDYQNKIIKSFTGTDKDVLIRLNHTLVTNTGDCINSNFVNCRVYDVTNNTNNVFIYVYSLFDRYSTNSTGKQYLNVVRPLLMSSIDRTTRLMLESSYHVADDYFVATTYDKDNLINSLTMLQENMLENIEIKDNILTGEIDSSKNGILFLSIPYDDNFKIYVDDEEVSYYSLIDNSFIGLDIEEGKHTIKMEYIDENYKWYIISTVSSIIVTLILYYFINKSIKKKKDKEEKIKQEKIEQEMLNLKKRKEKKVNKKKKNK